MLQALIEARSGAAGNNFYSTTPPPSSGGIMNLFDDTSPSTQQTQPSQSVPPQANTSALVGLFNDDDETLKDDKDAPKVEIIDY